MSAVRVDVEYPQGRLTEYGVMGDCGAVLHNIKTKWLRDFLTLEKCRNFSQTAVSRNVSQPASSRRIRALEQAIGAKLLNRQIVLLQFSEQGKIFHSQIRHLLQQLESNLAELRGGSDHAQYEIRIATTYSLSLGLLLSVTSRVPPFFTWTIEIIDVDKTVNKLRGGQSDCIFSFHDEDLLEAPFNHVRLFESQLFPVYTSDEHREALFNLVQPHFPLLNYSRNSHMGQLVNRALTRYSKLSFNIFFASPMSELLKQVAPNECGIAWLPEHAIQQEIRSGQLVVLNRGELVVPTQAYAYRMSTRMNPVAGRFWRGLCELKIEPGWKFSAEGLSALGIMIEVPAAVMVVGKLVSGVDFFSIGTSDLTQYTMAIDRGNGTIAKLVDYCNDAVISAIIIMRQAGCNNEVPASMYNGVAGDIQQTTQLLTMEIDKLSASPSRPPALKAAIRISH